jgi:hypothetical protein
VKRQVRLDGMYNEFTTRFYADPDLIGFGFSCMDCFGESRTVFPIILHEDQPTVFRIAYPWQLTQGSHSKDEARERARRYLPTDA